jgi:hypothetical protein
MEFLKTMAGKVVGGLVALVVIAGGISWWRMNAATKDAVLRNTGNIVAWSGAMLLLPWVTIFIISAVGRMRSNLAGGILVAVYSILELVLLLWLFGWSGHSTTGWTFIGVGTLIAAVYNLFACDWIAEKFE